MKKQERTFWDMIKELSKPVLIEKKISIKAVIPAILGSLI
jgi:hypothetical protein